MGQHTDMKNPGNFPQEQIALFEQYLEDRGASPKTVASYRTAVRLYFSLYSEMNPENLAAFRNYLASRYKTSTVNLRLHGMNQYMKAMGGSGGHVYQIPSVKRQQRTFLEHVISQKDYERIKRGLKRDQCMLGILWYGFCAPRARGSASFCRSRRSTCAWDIWICAPRAGKCGGFIFPILCAGGPGLDGDRGEAQRIFIYQPEGRTALAPGRADAAEGSGQKISCARGDGLSPLLPAPLRQEFPGAF